MYIKLHFFEVLFCVFKVTFSFCEDTCSVFRFTFCVARV